MSSPRRNASPASNFCALVYATKVWLTTILVGPFFLFFWSYLSQNGPVRKIVLEVLYSAIIGGLIFSMPAYVVYLFVAMRMDSLSVGKAVKKVILSGLTLALIATPFLLLFSYQDPLAQRLIFCYSAAAIPAIFLYSL